jgi:AraC-like DNA-binding protein
MHSTEFVKSYIDAWNHRDANGVAEHLCLNGTYCDIPANKQFSRDDLVSDLVDFFAADNHKYQLIGEVLSGQNTIAFQYKMLSPSANSDEWFGAEFMTLNGDAALRIADYYDPTHIATGAKSVPNLAVSKYAKSGLDAQRMQEYIGRLKSLMDDEKLYLEPDLTLPALAEMVDCSVNHLSQVVNSGFNMSFFDFLNSYRVQEAKLILSDDDDQPKSILDVSFAVGFNSNSAFYAAFKKATGVTPAQFRRSIISSVK